MAQITLSEHGFRKTDIFNLHFKGGLLHPDRTQKIVGSLYEPDTLNNLSAKFVMHFGIASESRDEYVEKPASLRFDNYSQLDALIFHELHANVALGRKTKAINPDNFHYMLKKALQRVEDHYREFLG